jgi:hypothetical protein
MAKKEKERKEKERQERKAKEREEKERKEKEKRERREDVDEESEDEESEEDRIRYDSVKIEEDEEENLEVEIQDPLQFLFPTVEDTDWEELTPLVCQMEYTLDLFERKHCTIRGNRLYQSNETIYRVY